MTEPPKGWHGKFKTSKYKWCTVCKDLNYTRWPLCWKCQDIEGRDRQSRTIETSQQEGMEIV